MLSRSLAIRDEPLEYVIWLMRTDTTTEQSAALQGIRVLDFTHALAGPYCTLLLADFGADVYKMESPGHGDMGRGWGPPFIGDRSSFFLGLNRGKKGISIDLKRPQGLDLCLRLLDKMDVLVENFRPGTMDRLGLGYDAMALRNPRLVYCSISGYGQQGPAREEAAMDLIVECSSGFLSITGTEAGEKVRSGYAVADVNAGMFAVIGIMMALRARERTGKGQFVDVAMLDGMISAMSSNYMTFLGSGKVPRPMGNSFLTVVPYAVFEARDGSFSIAVGSEKLWSAFCRILGRGDLEARDDFATNARRVENRQALHEILGAIFRERDVSEWIARLSAAGIPCSPVRNFAEVVEHPQTAVRDMFPTVDSPATGPHRVTGCPVKLSATPARVGPAAPGLGEHTPSVLSELLGMDAGAIEHLMESGIVVTA
jgi:crotonobetainyl-CoA:carnitine CoA-transferase CaiB-like acyl-CoA transferase